MDGVNEVWIVESGEYEERKVDLVGTSPEACLDALKSFYDELYVTEWGPLTQTNAKEFEVECIFGKKSISDFRESFTMSLFPINEHRHRHWPSLVDVISRNHNM